MSPVAPMTRCPTCKRLHPGIGRCPDHEREHDRARGTRQQRGYDADHDELRRAWQRRMDAGETVACHSVHCLTPDQLVDPRSWHLGHTADRTGWTGPEHPACNLAEAGRESHR